MGPTSVSGADAYLAAGGWPALAVGRGQRPVGCAARHRAPLISTRTVHVRHESRTVTRATGGFGQWLGSWPMPVDAGPGCGRAGPSGALDPPAPGWPAPRLRCFDAPRSLAAAEDLSVARLAEATRRRRHPGRGRPPAPPRAAARRLGIEPVRRPRHRRSRHAGRWRLQGTKAFCSAHPSSTPPSSTATAATASELFLVPLHGGGVAADLSDLAQPRPGRRCHRCRPPRCRLAPDAAIGAPASTSSARACGTAPSVSPPAGREAPTDWPPPCAPASIPTTPARPGSAPIEAAPVGHERGAWPTWPGLDADPEDQAALGSRAR